MVVSIGVQDHSSNFVKNYENMFVNILMCDIGNVMGLNHTGEENDLMYFTEFNELIMAQKDIF